ncbi:MAG: hypothetical protein ACSLE6_01880 [Mycobacterium sp.]
MDAFGVSDGELIIPIKWWRVLARSLYSVGVFAICVVGVAFLLSPRFSHIHIAWLIVGILFNLLFVVGAGMMAFSDLRTIRSRRLRLDSTGFAFGAHRWEWLDLAGIEVSREGDGEGGVVERIVVVPRPGVSESCEPIQTPINPPDFDTGGQPLHEILHSWLQRYGAHDQKNLS